MRGSEGGRSPLATAGVGHRLGRPHPDSCLASPGSLCPSNTGLPSSLLSRLPWCLAHSRRSEVLAVSSKSLNLVLPAARSSGTVLSVLIALSLAVGLAHH